MAAVQSGEIESQLPFGLWSLADQTNMIEQTIYIASQLPFGLWSLADPLLTVEEAGFLLGLNCLSAFGP